MKKLLGFLGIGAGLAALVGGGLALAKNHSEGVEINADNEEYEADYEDEDSEE